MIISLSSCHLPVGQSLRVLYWLHLQCSSLGQQQMRLCSTVSSWLAGRWALPHCPWKCILRRLATAPSTQASGFQMVWEFEPGTETCRRAHGAGSVGGRNWADLKIIFYFFLTNTQREKGLFPEWHSMWERAISGHHRTGLLLPLASLIKASPFIMVFEASGI